MSKLLEVEAFTRAREETRVLMEHGLIPLPV